MVIQQGTIVIADDPFKSENEPARPFVVLRNETQPFSEEQSICVTVTSSKDGRRISINDSDLWEKGGPHKLSQDSYISPWSIVSLSHDDFILKIGKLNDEFMLQVIESTIKYIKPEGGSAIISNGDLEPDADISTFNITETELEKNRICKDKEESNKEEITYKYSTDI